MIATPSPRSATARSALAALALALAGCASVPDQDRLLAPRADGQVVAATQTCSAARPRPAPAAPAAAALSPGNVGLVSWNIHKGDDEGWQADLGRYAQQYDVVMLQEAVLDAPMREVLERAGHGWQMVGAFAFNGVERGVLTASRATAVDGCALRSYEPITFLPKSAIVTRYAIAGRPQQLAVANLHGINFTLGMSRFREQIEAVADELARHDGPIVFGGDFNTWSVERHAVLAGITARLGLVPVKPEPDGRRLAFGHALDHLFVRGVSVVDARSPVVKSSDHNPILVRVALP